MVFNDLRDRGWICLRALAGDIPLIAEYALMRTARVGDEEGDDHGRSAQWRIAECRVRNKKP
jgi:hypothetical protein